MLKRALLAITALFTVAALPVAHADGYWGYNADGDQAWHDTQHIYHDQGEMQQAYWQRQQDTQAYWQARNSGDWDAMQRAQWALQSDNARIEHERQEIHHYRWDRYQSQQGDDD